MTSQTQVAAITGAASGIGWALAQTFASAGYSVCVIDLDGELSNTRASELAGPASGSHTGYGCDVSNAENVDRTFAAIVEQFGRLDVLVNNAGIAGSQEPSTEQDMDYFDKITKVIINGTFLCSRAAYHPMARQGGGVIVNIGSIAGLVGLRRRNAYGAAKAGVHSMTRSLACEWAPMGIRVNAVAPGYIATPLVRTLVERGSIDENLLERRIPMARLGTPEEVADAILFLASDKARYITGSILSVDGGYAAFGDSGNASEPE